MKLYFVRHGQTKHNRTGIHQGVDSKLSTEGKDQAKLVAKRLKNIDIDIIFSSPFDRARATAEIIAKELGKKIEFREELKEALWPTEMIGLHYSDPESVRIREEIRKNVHDSDFRYSDEENFFDLKQRAENFLQHLLSKHKHQNILCVSHGLIQKIFIGLIVFEEEFNSKLFTKLKDNSWMENTGITEVEYSDKYDWVLHTWNDKTHL